MNKKIFILLPDGIGIRNFVFTEFSDMGKEYGYDTVYWNNTDNDLSHLGYKEFKIQNSKIHPLTDILKKAKIQIALNQFIEKTNDKVFDTYRFTPQNGTLKFKIKNFAIRKIIKIFNSKRGLKSISNYIKFLERKTDFYKQCFETLKEQQPAFVLCTNQRHTNAIAPLLAAQDLNIPTATFIFSWDNLPKATMIVETDYYFVWSDFMKSELLFYYPYIKFEQVYITGTPQFESHFKASNVLEKEDFFNKNGLDLSKTYICFSGDDITTSPDDEQYLEDVANSIKKINTGGYNLGIIFRRCPVDFSDRYDAVLKKYSDIIVPLNPLWKQCGAAWNTVMPTVEDMSMQVNIIANSILVINLGSSMVFDFVTFKKPCLYLNYDVKNKKIKEWSTLNIYNFIHFRSMPTKEAVVWINHADEISEKVELILKNGGSEIVKNTEKWFAKINQHPPQEASGRIWKAIIKIIKQG